MSKNNLKSLSYFHSFVKIYQLTCKHFVSIENRSVIVTSCHALSLSLSLLPPLSLSHTRARVHAHTHAWEGGRVKGSGVNSDDLPHYLSDSISCAKCIWMKEQLYSVLLEWKFAQSISTLLQEEINKSNASDATNITKPTLCSESSVCDEIIGNRIPVVHNCNKKTKILWDLYLEITTNLFQHHINECHYLIYITQQCLRFVIPPSTYKL